MRCDEVRERLDDFVDARLGWNDEREVAEHLKACPSCHAEERALRRLLTAARALPREVAPARDLWPAIERQTAAGTVRAGRFGRWPGGAAGGRWLLVAAALLVASLGAVVGLVVLREARRGPAVRGAADAGTVSLALAPASEAAPAEHFARARAELRAALQERRGELSPATVEVIDRNLAVIEHAAAEIETAMARDPGNQHLRGLLLAVYRQEIELLLRAAKLPAAS